MNKTKISRKTTVWTYQVTSEISHQKTWIWCNGSMNVALRLMFQSNLRCNLTMRKRDERNKTSVFLYKVYFPQSYPGLTREKHSTKISQMLSLDGGEKLREKGERDQTQTLRLSSSFSVVALVRACPLVLSSIFAAGVRSICRVHLNIGVKIFGVFSYHRG